jgi:DNA mismatch repair protein MutL
VIRAFALAHPHVRFELRAEGRRVLATSGSGDLRGVVAELFGPTLASTMATLGPASQGDVEVSGLISRPPAARPDRQRIYVAVNGRPVRTPSLLEAVETAARPFFPKGRFPLAVVHLRLPPCLVDVNLSPTKDEVRILPQQEALGLLREAVRRALRETPLTEAVGASPLLGPWPSPRLAEGPPQWEEAPLRPLGQLLDTFLLAEGAQGLYIIDQHRAHERAIYESLLARKGQRSPLKEPIVLELKPHQAAMLRGMPALLAELGFSLEEFGRHHFLVREVPHMLENVPGRALEEAVQEALVEEEGWLERLLISLACRAAVRRGRRLRPEEVAAILEPYQRPGAPTLCPHGGPIALVIGREALARQLGLG